jgi:hypothetical protein
METITVKTNKNKSMRLIKLDEFGLYYVSTNLSYFFILNEGEFEECGEYVVIHVNPKHILMFLTGRIEFTELIEKAYSISLAYFHYARKYIEFIDDFPYSIDELQNLDLSELTCIDVCELLQYVTIDTREIKKLKKQYCPETDSESE